MKECKKYFQKENLRSRSFSLKLWYKQHYNVIVKITDLKMDFFHNTCFKERNNVAVAENLSVAINLLLKNVFQLSHGIKDNP